MASNCIAMDTVRAQAAAPTSAPNESQISGMTPLAQSLGFVARAGPTGPGMQPVPGLSRGPQEIRRTQDARQCPAGIIVDIGGESQFRARPHDPRQPRQQGVGDKTALMVPPFRPRIGIKQANAGQAGRGQGVDQIDRIARMNANIGQVARLDFGEKLRNPVDERFAAEIAALGMSLSVGRQMFAAAKAYFEPQIVGSMGKQCGGIAEAGSNVDANLGSSVAIRPA